MELQDKTVNTIETQASIPHRLKGLPHWVVWRTELSDGRNTKVPYVAGTNWSQHASSTNPSTWTTFEAAIKDISLSSTQGIGFAIHGAATEQEIVGFDLDGCRNPATGDLKEWAQQLIDLLASYVEITPSGTGTRIWVRGKLPQGDRVFNFSPEAGFGDKVKVEVFDHARYFTVTGEMLDPLFGPLDVEHRDLTDAYELCHKLREQFPAKAAAKSSPAETKPTVQIVQTGTTITSKRELLMHGKIVPGSRPFVISDDGGNSLSYPSQSEADMALCTVLATDGMNAEQIDEQLKKSSLYRPKWDRQDYSTETIRKATETARNIKDETKQNLVLSESRTAVLVFETEEDVDAAAELGFNAAHVTEPVAELRNKFTHIVPVGLSNALDRNGCTPAIVLPENHIAKPRVGYKGTKLYPRFASLVEARKVLGECNLREWLTKMLSIDAVTKYPWRRTTEPLPADGNSDDTIPPFDPSVVNGIYKEFVDLIVKGTTLAPQFAFVIAKTIVGIRMAGKVKFDLLDAEPRYYTTLIGETGSGKGEAWRRTLSILHPKGALGDCGFKIINSADSSVGIKDLFFDPPEKEPIVCYVDEVASLGNKATESRNPGIVDTMIELADSTSISRVLAKRKGGGSKTKHDARFAMVICGQSGDVFMKAFAGRTNLGWWDRCYPEFGVPQETGNLPPVDDKEAMTLLMKLHSLDYSGEMAMTPEAKDTLDAFWTAQPAAVRKKARWKKNLMLDAYMSAFGRGAKTVNLDDVDIAVKIFTRQLVIRQLCFKDEVPDRIGFYLGKLKAIAQGMEKRLAAGGDPSRVAKSKRDFEKESNAFRENELHIFARAWDVYSKGYLTEVTIKRENGQEYKKYLPTKQDEGE